MEAAVRPLADAIERGLRLCIVADYDATAPPPAPWAGAACACWARPRSATCARPRGGRLRPDAAHRTPRQGNRRRGDGHRGHGDQRRRRGRGQGPGPSGGGHRPPPARQLPAAGRCHRQPQPARLQLREQVHGRCRRDVLRAAGPACRVRARPLHKASQPRLEALLPLVAPGHGGRRGPAGRQQPPPGRPGPEADPPWARCSRARGPFEAAGRKAFAATTFDFGLASGPRINAAGRLSDMTIGIECLTTDDAGRAANLAQMLDAINRERRELEGGMREQALLMAEGLCEDGMMPPAAISVFDPDFHEGVVGIVASRIKDRMHRPSFVFAASGAPGHEHELKGSGRSIPGFHLRDALTSYPSATPACCCALAATPWRPAAPLPRPVSRCSKRPWPRWHRNGWTRPR
ncbi:SUMO-activating enzyme subunit 2 [Manis javanica]|nr:SUMO-activating enzyme subunit 2 [Manis javanica]